MNIIQDRVTVERLLLAVEQKDPEARVKLHQALTDARRDGGRQMTLLVGAAAAAAGGRLEIHADALAACSVGMGFTIREDMDTGSVTLEIVRGVDVEMLTTLRAAGVVAATEPVIVDHGQAARADPAQSTADAATRMATAVKTFLLQHYAGELQTRGRAFTMGLFAGLHGEAVGVGLTQDVQADPDGQTFEDRLSAYLCLLPAKLADVATATHELTKACAAAHPGDAGVALH